MDNTSYEFLELLRGTIDDKISTLDQTIYCKIAGINEDYTLDVTIVPDEHTRIQGVVNASKYNFQVGDYGILFKVGNNLANSFVIAKIGPSFEDNQPLSKQIQVESGDAGDNSIINNYYEIVQKAETYTHLQSSPSSLWTINHNLGKYPSVTVVTSSNDVVGGGDINYQDENNLTIEFSSAFSGKAFLN